MSGRKDLMVSLVIYSGHDSASVCDQSVCVCVCVGVIFVGMHV